MSDGRGGSNESGTTHFDSPSSLLLLSFVASFCYFVAMQGSNEALHYVSYPTAVLAKSSKLIPTMILGCLVERRLYSSQEWLAAACITSGVVLFNLSQNGKPTNSNSNSIYGIVLLLVSLCMDGMLGACQGLLKKQTTPPTATETMLYVNLYAIVFLVPLSIYTNEWSHGWQQLVNTAAARMNDDAGSANNNLQHTLVRLNASAAVGQIFIFLTITWYSSLVCTTITTTRKFFTIVLSVLYFGHVFTSTQWLSVTLVFFGLFTGLHQSKAKIETDKKIE